MGGVKMGSTGIVYELDQLFEAFLKEGLAQARLDEATATVEEQFGADAGAKLYVKVMQKVRDTGTGYINKELDRLAKLLANDGLKAEKKADFGRKRTLLQHFAGIVSRQG